MKTVDKENTNWQLQARVLVLQKKILRHKKIDPLRFLVPTILTNLVFTLALQTLLLSPNAPFSGWFVENLTAYLKLHDPLLRYMFNKLGHLQSFLDSPQWQPLAKEYILARELNPFLTELMNLGINVSKVCHIPSVDQEINMGLLDDNFSPSIKNSLSYAILQVCNGGISGLYNRIYEFIPKYADGHSQYLAQRSILTAFTAVGLMNSALIHWFRRASVTDHNTISSLQLVSYSTIELQELHSALTISDTELDANNKFYNKILFLIFLTAGLLVLLYNRYVGLPSPFFISLLTPFILPATIHVGKRPYNQYNSYATNRAVSRMGLYLQKKLGNCTVESLPGPTTTESILEVSCKKYKYSTALRALAYALRKEGFVCQVERTVARIYLTGNMQVFDQENNSSRFWKSGNTNILFWEFYQRVYKQLTYLDKISKIFKGTFTVTQRMNPIDNLPNLCVFLSMREYNGESKFDHVSNLKIIPSSDQFAQGYELLVTGELSKIEKNWLYELTKPFVTEEISQLASIKKSTFFADPFSTPSSSSKMPSKSPRDYPLPLLRPQDSKNSDSKSLAIPTKNNILPSIKWSSGLVYTPGRPEKTSVGLEVLECKRGARPYSIFIYNPDPDLTDVKDKSLCSKLRRHFTDPHLVGKKNKTGFVLGIDGIPKLKFLGKNGDNRIHPLRIETNEEGRTIYTYASVITNSHKAQKRGQIKKPRLAPG